MHHDKPWTFTGILLVAACAWHLPAFAGNAAPVHTATVEGIREYRLHNGLRVLLFPDPTKPKVTVNMTYFVGSRHEGYGETGMAHLLEHLMFKGTPDHPDIKKILSDWGASWNGTTWYDRTNYFETVNASHENLYAALALEADRMINSRIAKEDLASEMTVVRNEFEQGENDPGNVLFERMLSTAYLWHNYGKSTIGSRSDIEKVPIENLQAFYRKYYQPDNAMLVVAGKFDQAKTLAAIRRLFGEIAKPDRKLPQTHTVEPAQDGPREVVLRRSGDLLEMGAVYHICAAAHEDAPAIGVMVHILTTPQTGRLYQALVDPQHATRINGSAFALHDPGFVVFGAEVRRDGSLEKVRDIMLDVLERFSDGEITQVEVDRAKNHFTKNLAMLMNNTQRLAIRLSEWASRGDWRLLFLHRDRLEKVGIDDVRRVAARYLVASNRTTGLFVPDKTPRRAEIPDTPDVAALLRDYKGKKQGKTGEVFEATPDNIARHTIRTTVGEGIQLAMLPKRTRGEQVYMRMNLHYGTEEALTGKTVEAGMMGNLLMQGTQKYTNRQLLDEIDRLKAQVQVGGGGTGALRVTAQCSREHLQDVLRLIEEILKRPTFPKKELEKFRKKRLAGLERRLTDPRALAQRSIERILKPVPPDDIRYSMTFEEAIEKIKAVRHEDIVAVHRDFVGAGHMEAAFVGDFDPVRVEKLITTLFADWKSPAPYARVVSRYYAVDAVKKVIVTPDKANSFVIMGLNLKLRDDHPDFPALLLGNHLLGGHANARLWKRLREKEGLSYGVGSGINASALDETGGFSLAAICAPQNNDKAVAYALEEIEGMLREGVGGDELDQGRKGLLERMRLGLSNDKSLCNRLANYLFTGRDMAFLKRRMADIAALSVDDVDAAMRKYILPRNLVIVTAGDLEAKQRE